MLIAIDHRAGPLTKSDLKYRYSESIEADNPLQLEEPDPSRLNRQDWYEVLYFVNMFANRYGKGSTGVARHAEKLLHEHVPPELHSYSQIKQWLLDHWKFHS
ncbi:MAG: hypothetical protein A3I66_06490 [Burkholderiales bacterium RIFCSPLOWO2_02_FULL_57_36]|nr:MAG: hypothetical protein A3I66_06490 [Burkholderiales bacterium RIFCSPLOWO2_02_FULL_57_36]